jgi:hypothetical protein
MLNDTPLRGTQEVTFVMNLPKNQGLTGFAADLASSAAPDMLA